MRRFVALALLLALVAPVAGRAQTEAMHMGDGPSIAVRHASASAPLIEQGARIGDLPTLAVSPALGVLDGRQTVGPNVVHVHIARPDGTTVDSFSHNSRVDAGASAVANNVSGTAVAVFNYIAMTADSATPLKGDTTCPSEITTGGLGRTLGTYGGYIAPTVLNGTASYTVTAAFTATAGYTINKLCMFNAASTGTMLFETKLAATVTGNSGDVLNVTWTITL